MKQFFLRIFIISTLIMVSCKKEPNALKHSFSITKNSIKYAKGLEIFKYDGFSIVTINKPWPTANKGFTYILKEANAKIPDSLLHFNVIDVPIKSIVVTSTTHIYPLELLGVENTLKGFPNLDYISSKKVRNLIKSGKIKDLGNNQNLNLELVLDIAPSVIVGYGIDNFNPSLDNIEKSGLKVILNGDWNEQNPLGKAEWIKFFGALYNKNEQANTIFSAIESNYKKALSQTKNIKKKPTVLVNAMFENTWFVPQGESWGSFFLKDAKLDYLWKDENGTGGLELSFETVYEKALDADIWIGPGQFKSLKELEKANPHYSKFKAFKEKKVYSYSIKKGEKGGIIYFEIAPYRPDLVLRDLIKIGHPNLEVKYNLQFFEKLN